MDKTARKTLYQNKQPDFQKWTEYLNRHFPKEDIQMANRQMKICLLQLIMREMQIKTTMRYHLTPIRMAVFKKSTNDRCWQRCGPNGAIVHHGKQWQVLKKIKIQLPCDPQIPLLGIISEENENTYLKRYMHVSVRSSIIQNSQDVEATMCPSIDEWIKKMWGVCVYTMESIYLSIYPPMQWNIAHPLKKNEIRPFTTMRMDLEGIMFSEICPIETEKYCMISFICGN